MMNEVSEVMPERLKEDQSSSCQEAICQIADSDLFPIIPISENDLQKYQKIPLASIASLGTAFSQFSDAARMVVQEKTTQIGLKETLFVGINPKNVPGFLRSNEYGTVGNIMQVNSQGKQVIAGRMRFKALDSVPMTETSTMKLPLDPTMAVVAVALMTIEKKLDTIRESVEDVLQFLALEKQAKQRGNLAKLIEIAEDYKTYCNDADFCANRNQTVQSIQVSALEDIEFYQKKISLELKKQKTLHLSTDANTLLQSVKREFSEYQLACYLYAYCGFEDILLRRDFASAHIEKCVSRMTQLAGKYNSLFSESRERLEKYQHSTVESKLLAGVGGMVTGIGKAIGAIPVVRDGQVDETLISAGKTIGKKAGETADGKMEAMDCLEDSRMTVFIDNLHMVNAMYNGTDTLLADGENLYCLTEK